MTDHSTFTNIKQKHGHYASWAVWADGAKPKENVGDLSIFDVQEGDTLLQQLNPHIVLVALNISRPIESPFGNFHDKRPGSQDYKIRYALKGTSLWGAYMTDIIKDFEQKAAGRMMAYLRQNKSFEHENIASFEAEIKDLGASRPTLIAFGGDAYRILYRNLHGLYDIVKVTHYSHYMSKEAYREAIAGVMTSRVTSCGRQGL
jgi:hypothetical protein